MTNKLSKSTNLTFLSGTPAAPAQPYIPAKAGWTEVITERICEVKLVVTQASPGYYRTIRVRDWNQEGAPWVYMNEYVPPVLGGTSRKRVCLDQTRTVYHPGTPGQPAKPAQEAVASQVLRDYRLGWNAGARSIKAMDAGGYTEFKITQAVGATVGLSSQDEITDPEQIQHGFYAQRSSLRITERGREVFNAGQFNPADVLKIKRMGAIVEYSSNGQTLYRSQTPSVGPVYLAAALYSGGDTVDSPVIADSSDGVGHISGRMQSVAGQWSDRAYASFQGSMAEAVGFLDARRSLFNGKLAALTGSWADRPYSAFNGVTKAPTGKLRGVTGNGGSMAPAFSHITGAMYPPLGYMHSFTGGMLSAAENFISPISGWWADRPYGRITNNNMAPATGYMADPGFTQPAQPLRLNAVVDMRGGSAISLSGHAGVVSMDATVADDPLPVMQCEPASVQMETGAQFSMEAGAVQVQMKAAVTDVAQLEMRAPASLVYLQGTADVVAQMQMLALAGKLELVSGGQVAMTLSSAPQLTLQATAEVLARFTLHGPAAMVQMQAAAENMAQMQLHSPALRPVSWAQAVLTMPLAKVWMRVSASAAQPAHAFGVAVNLRSALEDGGHEATTLQGYGFTSFVRWRGKQYAVNQQGLHALGGHDDDGAPIEWSFHTGTTDFGMPQKKTPLNCYVGGRLGPVTRFEVQAGQRNTPAHLHLTPRGEAAQNYRQRFGMGLDARYYSFGMAGDGELVIDSLEFDVRASKRRI